MTKEKFEEFMRLLERLQHQVARGRSVLLVEGVRDRAALLGLGIPPSAISLVNRGSSLVKLAETLAQEGRKVIVLTDWDGAGARLAHRITENLRACGVPIDTEFRRKIARAVCGEVLEVENLKGWAERESELHREPLPRGPSLGRP